LSDEGAGARAAAPTAQAPWLWIGVAALLGGGALLAASAEPHRLDWQPDLARAQPWRWWTAAWVHWSESHRWANLAGTALVGAFGWRAGCTRADALAWLAAWPLTHMALWWSRPDLAHYGGLSGVLHAGVVVAGCALLRDGQRRWLGALVLIGVTVKVWLEQPWLGPLQRWPHWDIAIAPAAHASGAMAGVACALAAHVLHRARRRVNT
jgi:rhomboid family GlyGly-CTERM serine protease